MNFQTTMSLEQALLLLKLGTFSNVKLTKKYKHGEYMFITRRTVLGRWREIKMKMYSLEKEIAQSL